MATVRVVVLVDWVVISVDVLVVVGTVRVAAVVDSVVIAVYV